MDNFFMDNYSKKQSEQISCSSALEDGRVSAVLMSAGSSLHWGARTDPSRCTERQRGSPRSEGAAVWQ